MGLLGIIFKVVAAVVLVVVGLGAYLYFTDANVQAKVTDRASDPDCPATASTCSVTVTPNLAPFYHYKTNVDRQYWTIVCPGYTVDFRLQTHAMTVKDRDGKVVYESGHPPAITPDLVRCAGLPAA
jgi:hypothetical protein